jgi:tRNA(fMet)-specific endonuclease VapC
VRQQYLLDTNIISAFLKHERLVQKRISEIDHLLSPIVIGELYKGAFAVPNKAELLVDIRDMIRLGQVLPLDETTGERWGVIATTLQQRGESIPINDIWIAAQALQHNLVLVTRDDHFKLVPGLKLDHW